MARSRPYSILELPELLALWDRATRSDFGIKIRTSNATNLMQKLNAVRRETNNAILTKYAVCVREGAVYVVPHEQIKSRTQAMREARGL